MINEVHTAKMCFYNEVNQVKTFVEPLAQGKYRITSKTAEGAYNRKTESKNFDRYNWDGGKKVEIFGITITDQFMGEFHRQGAVLPNGEYLNVGADRSDRARIVVYLMWHQT